MRKATKEEKRKILEDEYKPLSESGEGIVFVNPGVYAKVEKSLFEKIDFLSEERAKAIIKMFYIMNIIDEGQISTAIELAAWTKE